LRSTAFPTVRLTAKATRASPAAGSRQTVTVTGPERERVPSRRSATNVRRSRTRPTRGRGEGGDTARPWPSGRQTVAALVAARLEDRSSGSGGHPMPKTVSLCSFADVWLVGALHCSLFCAKVAASGPTGCRVSHVPGARTRGAIRCRAERSR
jgi:hypothetical protein